LTIADVQDLAKEMVRANPNATVKAFAAVAQEVSLPAKPTLNTFPSQVQAGPER
jgi:hypothetical protein